jgi:heme oxygenase
MAAGAPDRGDVLQTLRTATAQEHERVEAILGLMSSTLDRARLAAVLTLLHSFWRSAEDGLDAWAQREPADAAGLEWPTRRRGALFAADLRALGAEPADDVPQLPPVAGTDDALGRLYVLEGSTLGGTFIHRHLATLPDLAATGRLRAFSPYGTETGAMWHSFRRFTRARTQDPQRVVATAGATFRSLAEWCAPVAA